VRLNVRGVCCLRPGIEGVSRGVEVTSIVDRFLEHARIFYFRNGGHEEVYLSSADWMSRNLDRRLEVLFPVTDARLRARLIHWLEVYLADNVKAWRLRADGSYERVDGREEAARAQEVLYREAVETVRAGGSVPTQFRPLTSREVERAG
jgi:polyphosphate kinase